MSVKYPRSKAIENAKLREEPAYVSWNGDLSKNPQAVAAFSGAVSEFRQIKRASGRFNEDLSNLATNVSGRPGLSKSDYYSFRPGEKPPRTYKDIITTADAIYRTVGLIRNTIDLMADFAIQGIRLVHPNKKIEKFYQNWFSKIDGVERSERFLNNLYRLGNVIIRKQTAKLNKKSEKKLYKTVANPDLEIKQSVINKKEIPWKYTFLNPQIITVVGGELSSFAKNKIYALTLSTTLKKQINRPSGVVEKEIVNQLPEEIKKAADNPRLAVVLPRDKTLVFHYKKDDWQIWADPMIYSIMDDLIIYEKLRLADMSALDGAISKIRVWKLGSLEHKIAPTRNAASKLAEILESNVGGGTMDLIWSADIDLLESDTNVHQFLGGDKYEPHLNAIFAGLGIPQTLTGMVGASGTTNNLMALKTLITRLNYGRRLLTQFWNAEVAEVQHAMGFRLPAKVEFQLTNLGDEAAERALLIQMADRNLISDELLQHYFGNDAEMEKVRLNRESRERNNGKLVPKASPYHDPQFGIALKKLALQTGIMSPSQVGLRKDAITRDLRTFDPEDGEKPALEVRQVSLQEKKPPGQNGRPKNSRDTKPRKQKRFVPKSRAALEIWAKDAQVTIAEILNPWILQVYKKKNIRSFTNNEADTYEKIKFNVLYNLNPYEKVNKEKVLYALSKGRISKDINYVYNYLLRHVGGMINRKLTLDEIKHIQTCVYATYKGDI